MGPEGDLALRGEEALTAVDLEDPKALGDAGESSLVARATVCENREENIIRHSRESRRQYTSAGLHI